MRMIDEDLGRILPDLGEFVATPNSFAGLRRLVLAYAFSGKLRGPAGIGANADGILEGIQASLKGTKHGLSTPLVPSDEAPYALPEGWRWVRLSIVCTHIVDCLHRTPAYSSSGYPAIRTNDILPGKLLLETARRVPRHEYLRQTQRLVPQTGDIFYSREGNYGMAAVVPTGVEICLSQRMMQFRLHEGLDPAYFSWALNSPVMFDQAKKSVIGTTVPHINIRVLRNFAFPLAPSSDQRHIVEWIDKAMNLIDRLETAHWEEEEERHFLTKSAFSSLSRSADTFALDHLHELVRTVGDVRELEQTIHELAVHGRLTHFQLGDESVPDYLDKISSAALDQPHPVDAQGRSIPNLYELPDGWQWVALGSLLTGIQAGWSPSAQARPKEGDEWGVLKVSACSWGAFRPEENKALFTGETPRPELEVQPGDFLISRANTAELVGRSVILKETPARLMLSDKTLRLFAVPGCSIDYLNLANLAQAARAHYEEEATGTSSSMRNVSQRAIRRTPIPLPPPAEQDRIMAVVSQLTSLVRKLYIELAS
jgi:type I restriction enzyme S subunit